MSRTFLSSFLILLSVFAFAQNYDAIHDPEAGALLKASSDKYKKMGGLQTDFKLTIIRPKLKAEEPDSKYTDVLNGKLWVKGNAFKINLGGNEIICNGKDIWTYNAKQKECQLNEYVAGSELFSPAQLFNLYDASFGYQIKEKKIVNGKNSTVVELIPANKKSSYFKIDVSLDDATKEITEAKVYEKNGVRYFYRPSNTIANTTLNAAFFTFDSGKYPNVHIEDLR